uniref:Uncharacterized protein n=2 Tax=Brassica campestris TaxID=3711 RepID=M4DBN7_BRACM
MNKPAAVSGAVGSEALNMERSGGINNMRLPTSPMSFPSSNINIPGSLVLDGSASIQHLSQQQQQQAGQGSVPMGESNYSHIDKKPRLDVNVVAAAVSTSVDPASGPRRTESSVASFASAAETEATTTAADSSILVTVSEIPTPATTAENFITYWKKFVAEYFSPRAKQRLCLSQYENAGHHALGMFPQAAPILSWEFCARRHEELLLRRLIAPQVNQLLQVAQKCQTTISESGVLGAGRQLAKLMELQSLNDLGYPKRYIRTLQISEVVKSMKDLMNFTGDHKLGPIEGLKRLLEQTATAKLQIQRMQEMEQLGNSGAMNGSSQAQMALTSGTMNGLTGNNNNNSSNNQTVGRVPSRNNSFTAASNNNLHLSKDVSVTELSHGFSDDCFFNNSDIYGSL